MHKILVISDLDGSLTDTKNPHPHPHLRASVDRLLCQIKGKEIPFMVSSAWNEPTTSTETISALGISGILGAELSMTREEILGVEYDVYKNGRLCGVKEDGAVFYSHKALAPLLLYSAEQLQSFEVIIFMDDNSKNIENFELEIKNIGLNSTTEVRIYKLRNPERDCSEESSSEESEENWFD